MKYFSNPLTYAAEPTCQPFERLLGRQPINFDGKLKAWASAMMLLVIGYAVLPASLNAGQVLAYSFHSETLGRDWRYNVYLPDGYDHSNLRYPVLFMLHGFSENENAWVTKGRRIHGWLATCSQGGRPPRETFACIGE
jgi:Putative esterase